MGTPVPIDSPVIDDNLWYKVFVDAFWDFSPLEGCDQEHIYSGSCCVPGWTLNDWISGGWQCKPGGEICVYSNTTSQRITNIHGPYDSSEECLGDE